LSRNTCKAREAVTTETPKAAAMSRELGTRAPSASPIRDSSARAISRYFGSSAEGQAVRIEEHLNQQAKHSFAVVQLRSIPGVGVRTAEAVAAFVDDPHRFPNAKQVGRSFGLVPSQDQSGDRNRLAHITREGPAVVRQLVTEASWQAVRRSPTVRAFFERERRGDPERKKIAPVATAHYLVRVMLALLKCGTTWEESRAPADEPKGAAPTVSFAGPPREGSNPVASRSRNQRRDLSL
jgi:transposase